VAITVPLDSKLPEERIEVDEVAEKLPLAKIAPEAKIAVLA
jgi:hypothetical protein